MDAQSGALRLFDKVVLVVNESDRGRARSLLDVAALASLSSLLRAGADELVLAVVSI